MLIIETQLQALLRASHINTSLAVRPAFPEIPFLTVGCFVFYFHRRIEATSLIMEELCLGVSCKYRNFTNITGALVKNSTLLTEPVSSLALRDLFVAFSIFNGLISITALALNLLIIAVFATTPSLRTPRNIILLNLALSDAATAILPQPVFCVHLYSYLYGPLDLAFLTDYIFFGSFETLSMVSFCTLTLISADRYLAIRIHMRYSEIVTTKRYCICIAMIWIFSVVATGVRFINEVIIYTPVIDIVVFVSVSLLNGFFMVKIALAVRRHASQIHAQRSALDMPKYKRSVNTTFYVMIVFFLCYIGHVVGCIVLAVVQEWNELVSFILTYSI